MQDLADELQMPLLEISAKTIRAGIYDPGSNDQGKTDRTGPSYNSIGGQTKLFGNKNLILFSFKTAISITVIVNCHYFLVRQLSKTYSK